MTNNMRSLACRLGWHDRACRQGQVFYCFRSDYCRGRTHRKRKVRIGYLCRQGHFQLNGDAEGDSCQLKNVGEVFVRGHKGIPADELAMYIQDALDSHSRKLEEWRRA